MVDTVTVKATLTKYQAEVIEELEGVIGSNPQDTVAKIVLMWLHQQGLLKKEGLKNKPKKI